MPRLPVSRIVLASVLPLLAASSSTLAQEGEPTADAAEARPRLLVLDLAANGVEADVVKTISGVLAAELSEYDAVDVLTGDDIRRTVELEAQRTSVGCEDTSCLSELAGALGADVVIYGDVGRLGSLLVMNLSLFDTRALRSIARVSARAESLEDVPHVLRPKLADLLAPWYEARGLTLVRPEPLTARSDGVPWLPWAIAGSGGALVVVGGAVAALGSLPWFAFQRHSSSLAELESQGPSTLASAREEFASQEQARADWQAWGGPLVVAGAVGLTLGVLTASAGVAWGALGGDEGAAE